MCLCVHVSFGIVLCLSVICYFDWFYLPLWQEVVPDWQNAASGLLVALGAEYCDEVMAEMFERFQPGTLPHYFVVRTIGNLAQANGIHYDSVHKVMTIKSHITTL